MLRADMKGRYVFVKEVEIKLLMITQKADSSSYYNFMYSTKLLIVLSHCK
jgi:hypothetical protein